MFFVNPQDMIVHNLLRKHTFIKLFRNSTNQNMDGNGASVDGNKYPEFNGLNYVRNNLPSHQSQSQLMLRSSTLNSSQLNKSNSTSKIKRLRVYISLSYLTE